MAEGAPHSHRDGPAGTLRSLHTSTTTRSALLPPSAPSPPSRSAETTEGAPRHHGQFVIAGGPAVLGGAIFMVSAGRCSIIRRYPAVRSPVDRHQIEDGTADHAVELVGLHARLKRALCATSLACLPDKPRVAVHHPLTSLNLDAGSIAMATDQAGYRSADSR